MTEGHMCVSKNCAWVERRYPYIWHIVVPTQTQHNIILHLSAKVNTLIVIVSVCVQALLY